MVTKILKLANHHLHLNPTVQGLCAFSEIRITYSLLFSQESLCNMLRPYE